MINTEESVSDGRSIAILVIKGHSFDYSDKSYNESESENVFSDVHTYIAFF